jgi:hypothetical protein
MGVGINCPTCNKWIGLNGLAIQYNDKNAEKSFDGKWCCNSVCARDYNNRYHNNNNASSGTSSNVPSTADPNTIAQAEAQKAQAKSQENAAKSMEKASMWNAIGTTASTLGVGILGSVNDTNEEIKQIRAYLSQIRFSTNPDEAFEQLSEICTIWAGAEKYQLDKNKDAVQHSAFEKFEFGFVSFKSIGQKHQIDFLTKKRKQMNPRKFFGLF